jgi:hypothetical protein
VLYKFFGGGGFWEEGFGGTHGASVFDDHVVEFGPLLREAIEDLLLGCG